MGDICSLYKHATIFLQITEYLCKGISEVMLSTILKKPKAELNRLLLYYYATLCSRFSTAEVLVDLLE